MKSLSLLIFTALSSVVVAAPAFHKEMACDRQIGLAEMGAVNETELAQKGKYGFRMIFLLGSKKHYYFPDEFKKDFDKAFDKAFSGMRRFIMENDLEKNQVLWVSEKAAQTLPLPHPIDRKLNGRVSNYFQFKDIGSGETVSLNLDVYVENRSTTTTLIPGKYEGRDYVEVNSTELTGKEAEERIHTRLARDLTRVARDVAEHKSNIILGVDPKKQAMMLSKAFEVCAQIESLQGVIEDLCKK